MKCTLDYDKILAYCLGELPSSEAEEVERHVASCPRCALELTATDGILKGLTGLPRTAPGAERWIVLRDAIELERPPGAGRLISALVYSLKRPAVAAAAALLMICAVGGYLFMRGGLVPSGPEVAVEEMGSTIAYTRPGDRGFGDALDSYLDDSLALVAAASRCAASADAGCWRDLALKIAEGDMLYRGIWLGERLPRPSGTPQAESVETRALIDGSLGIFRAVSGQTPERLIRTGNAIGEEIARMDLLTRLRERGGH